MLINSLAALALGFALDMLLGDPEVVVYPQYFIKKLVAKLDKSFRNSYKNTPEAQRMAGLMMTVIVLLIVAAVTPIRATPPSGRRPGNLFPRPALPMPTTFMARCPAPG